MLEKIAISKMIEKAVNEAIKQNHLIDLNTKFTGINSTFESIDIVQIISSVEDQLEKNGFEGCDLLERTFETDELDFNDFIDLVYRVISE